MGIEWVFREGSIPHVRSLKLSLAKVTAVNQALPKNNRSEKHLTTRAFIGDPRAKKTTLRKCLEKVQQYTLQEREGLIRCRHALPLPLPPKKKRKQIQSMKESLFFFFRLCGLWPLPLFIYYTAVPLKDPHTVLPPLLRGDFYGKTEV